MKTSLIIISILSVATFFSCESENATPKSRENLTMADFDCLNKQANQSLTVSEANKLIYGKWKLYGMLTMLPTKEIPDIKLILSNLPTSPSEKPVAEIFENGVLKGMVKFVLKEMKWETYTNVVVESENVSLPADYYNFIKGNIRICEGELMIDNGIAFDAPAYLFRKIK
jgi:hypothetical protein